MLLRTGVFDFIHFSFGIRNAKKCPSKRNTNILFFVNKSYKHANTRLFGAHSVTVCDASETNAVFSFRPCTQVTSEVDQICRVRLLKQKNSVRKNTTIILSKEDHKRMRQPKPWNYR